MLLDPWLVNLLKRVEAIEARQHVWGHHDPDCPVTQRMIAQQNSMMYIMPRECDCWIADERTD